MPLIQLTRENGQPVLVGTEQITSIVRVGEVSEIKFGDHYGYVQESLEDILKIEHWALRDARGG